MYNINFTQTELVHNAQYWNREVIKGKVCTSTEGYPMVLKVQIKVLTAVGCMLD